MARQLQKVTAVIEITPGTLDMTVLNTYVVEESTDTDLVANGAISRRSVTSPEKAGTLENFAQTLVSQAEADAGI